MADKKKKDDKNKVHEELEGFDIRINSFGEIQANFDVDKLNEFLNENIDDKKLQDKTSKPKSEKGSKPKDK